MFIKHYLHNKYKKKIGFLKETDYQKIENEIESMILSYKKKEKYNTNIPIYINKYTKLSDSMPLYTKLNYMIGALENIETDAIYIVEQDKSDIKIDKSNKNVVNYNLFIFINIIMLFLLCYDKFYCFIILLCIMLYFIYYF